MQFLKEQPARKNDARVKVLVVDDSHFMQRRVQEILESVSDIRVIGYADNGAEAILRAEALNPDVITMDVNMPKLDGLHAIDYIMRSKPRPIVVVSSYTRKGGAAAVHALDLGVVDIVEKPSVGGVSLDLHQQAAELIAKVRMAARVRVVRTAMKGSAPAALARTRPDSLTTPQLAVAEVGNDDCIEGVPQVVCIGSSTGGPMALKELLRRMPNRDFPPILILQHLPEKFTRDLAHQLDAVSSIEVVEAEDGWPVVKGFAYVAPGGRHMELDAAHRIVLTDAPPVNYCRPAVDVLFESVAKQFGPNALALVLTGMGDDGAAGAVALRNAGSKVIAQDEESCIVFGMPQAAIKAGGVDEVLSLTGIETRLGRIAVRIFQHSKEAGGCAGQHQCNHNFQNL